MIPDIKNEKTKTSDNKKEEPNKKSYNKKNDEIKYHHYSSKDSEIANTLLKGYRKLKGVEESSKKLERILCQK